MWSNIFWDFEFAGKMVKLNQLGNKDTDICIYIFNTKKAVTNTVHNVKNIKKAKQRLNIILDVGHCRKMIMPRKSKSNTFSCAK